MQRFSFQPIVLLVAIAVSLPSARADEPTNLPAMSVSSPPVPGENKIVGTYGQPEWSARRPFPGVSVYVQPVAQIEFEMGFENFTVWSGAHHREWNQEIEAGLGHRWQVAAENVFANFREGAERPSEWHHDSLKLSARYALADWGKIPLNPALGGGWRFHSGAADSAVGQLVLGAEAAPRLHWAADFQYEGNTGDRRLREFTAATALTYSVTNETLNVGLQAQWKRTSGSGDPVSTRREIGPCVQYRPVDQLHLDCVALWGTERGRAIEGIFVSIGFEFGKGADDHDDDRERGGGLAR
ncbi:MAG TPA: hypothetical protein VFJ90_16275 [Candidatus Didemnitutus sp.]|nr:hypothetical protein [Candidatus Didemnitutus sp.]